MKWFPLYPGMVFHKKTSVLADKLRVTRTTAVGVLVRLWSWSVQHAPDGIIRITSDELQDIVGLERGIPVLQALYEAGWMKATPQGAKLHQWEQYGGRAIASVAEASAKRADRRGRAEVRREEKNQKRRERYAKKTRKALVVLDDRRPEKA